MWELLTGEEPYADLHYGAIIGMSVNFISDQLASQTSTLNIFLVLHLVGGIVNNTLRPHVPETCDPDWRALMERCWSSEPRERPNFTEIADELRAMANKLPSKGQLPQPKS